ncbi:hypothetical protein COCC4DRAFT_184392 [Bipolaris maydis ATCC 48331]|uniref:Uncharacterized protein n=2 Tax=Cochliobolus heterostrophus TaxID=5016 RepID=M2TFC3_COCH5|nr:uncharacterized protein COCC4DRAFT_184392 [Bipolaris maydis ATCC 48331]EMD96155.1 hypothetical protein COCHEDRAFT_1167084 [Bipolaris maydis C5]ENI11014.1 hypothetical protein COCC4DRAFT_184392 [Bipolaris maydis ATCC 48331]KAJ6213081.1 hypothetical protein PSV09DRAFT_1167084 [Bipolaris maydis]
MASPSDSQQQPPPNFNALLQYLQSQAETTDTETTSLATDIQKLDVGEETTEQDKVNAYVAEFLYIGGPEMPVHPVEDSAPGSITDKVAKESSDSTASSHGMHNTDSIQQVQAQMKKGPVLTRDLPEPASKEELKKRAEELNK